MKIVLGNKTVLPIKLVEFRDNKVYRFAPADREDVKWFYPAGNHKLIEYTGIQDKNGREIYEGDIVRIGTLEGEPLGTIEWIADQAHYEIRDNEKYQFGGEQVSKLHASWFDIIGNIHENPELLKPYA